MNLDIEHFLTTGEFGILGRSADRAQIIAELGPPDPGINPNYPDALAYGPILFHGGGGIQMCFPHDSYGRPAHPSWTNWQRPTWLDDWPDKRINCTFGQLTAHATLADVTSRISPLDELELISPADGRTRIFHNPLANLQITFELQNGQHALSEVVVWPLLHDL